MDYELKKRLATKYKVDPARYTTWKMTLSNPDTGEVVSRVFDNECDGEAAMDYERKLRRFPWRSLDGEFYSPACEACNDATLSKDDVWSRLRFDCDELICDDCYLRRRIELRERVPKIIDELLPFMRYDTVWMSSTLKFFVDRVEGLPDVPGVYCLSMLITDVDGVDRVARYVGQSGASLKSRCLTHADNFAKVLIGRPPTTHQIQKVLSESQAWMGLFHEGTFRRHWSEVFTPSELALLKKYSGKATRAISEKTGPTTGSTSRKKTRLIEFVKQHGARFDVCALETFSDIEPYELSEARWDSIHTGRQNRHPGLKRILDAEAKWQRELGTNDTLRLWTVDTTKRLND